MSLTCPAARSGPARSGGGSAGSRADRSTGGPPASLYNGELASRTRQYSLLTCPHRHILDSWPMVADSLLFVKRKHLPETQADAHEVRSPKTRKRTA